MCIGVVFQQDLNGVDPAPKVRNGVANRGNWRDEGQAKQVRDSKCGCTFKFFRYYQFGISLNCI